jgi:predicted enzyme related to lactoylglutathione lyase
MNILRLDGKVRIPKSAVPNMEYFAICSDTENNTFALWEKDGSAK